MNLSSKNFRVLCVVMTLLLLVPLIVSCGQDADDPVESER